MIEATDELSEPDLVLTVAPPVPRRGLRAPVAPPTPPARSAAVPPSVPARSGPRVPPPVPPPALPDRVDTCPVVAVDEEPATDGWPDRRWLTSTGVSLIVHVLVLVMLALIVESRHEERRPRPIEIARVTEEPEELPFEEPQEEMVVEVLDPTPEPPLDVPVDQVEVAVDGAADTTAALVAIDDPLAGTVDLEAEGILARLGGTNGGGAGPVGFGGEVGRRLARAGAKSGDIQVSLSWENFNDLDLHVVAPTGEHIFFGYRRSRCRGTLDVDMNAMGPATREPVENVFWPAQAAPPGDYEVFVHQYARFDTADETPFEVHVLVDGVRRTFSGQVKFGEPPVSVTRFSKQAEGDSEKDDFVE